MFASSLLTAGVVSCTFRKSPIRDVVRLAKQAKLQAIEWGADGHVPPGDIKQARTAKEMSRDAGLTITAYDCGYRLGEADGNGGGNGGASGGGNGGKTPFKLILDTAMELAAPTVRVWAGAKGSLPHDPVYRNQVIEESRRIASQAAAAGVSVAYEFAAGSLADANESALQLLRSVNHPNVRTFWQPPAGQTAEYAIAGLQGLLTFVTDVHVQHWSPGTERQPLDAGDERWRQYIRVLRGTGRPHALLLEYVLGDSPEQFQKDAATLREWLE